MITEKTFPNRCKFSICIASILAEFKYKHMDKLLIFKSLSI